MTYASTIRTSFQLPPDDWYHLKLYVPKTGQQLFPVEKLVYIQAATNYSWLNWKDGHRMLMPRTLSYYMPYLPQAYFIRVHRNCVINCQYIDRITRTETGGLVYLTTGDVLPISRRRWHSVLQRLDLASTMWCES